MPQVPPRHNMSSKEFSNLRILERKGIHKISLPLLPHPTLFDGAEEMIPQIAGMLRDVGRESLVILYTPSIDRTFSVLMRQADHIIEITLAEDIVGTALHRNSRSHRNSETLPYAQQTLEVS